MIFCHSALPQFFNPTNYKTICATLPTIDVGERIIIRYDGVTYQYQVTELIEVKPDDLSVLDQDYSQRSLSLVTCVPPGTYLRRLVVKADLR